MRTDFPRFQEFYTLIVEFRNDPELERAAVAGSKKEPRCTTAKMYVGKYFTEKGEFDEVS